MRVVYEDKSSVRGERKENCKLNLCPNCITQGEYYPLRRERRKPTFPYLLPSLLPSHSSLPLFPPLPLLPPFFPPPLPPLPLLPPPLPLLPPFFPPPPPSLSLPPSSPPPPPPPPPYYATYSISLTSRVILTRVIK